MPAPTPQSTSMVTIRVLKVMREVIASEFEPAVTNQATFAKAIGVNPVVLSRWLAGNASCTVDNLITICERFKVSGDYLLTGKGDMYIRFHKENVTARIDNSLIGINQKLDNIITAMRNETSRNKRQLQVTKIRAK